MEKIGNIFLIGFMGCGKSTVASKLNQLYGMHVVEMDKIIADEQGIDLTTLFHAYGETYFRDLESDLLKRVAKGTEQVVSCGGGVVLRESNVTAMKKSGRIVLLTAKPESILSRVIDDTNRPILEGKKNVEDIATLMETRRAKYETAADIVVVTDDKAIEEICKEILEKIKGIGV